MRKVLADMQNILAAQCVAVVWPMQRAFDTVQLYAQARLCQRLGRRAKMVQQRFDLAPLDVSADRILKDRAEEIFVFAAHRWLLSEGRGEELSVRLPASRSD